MEKQYLFDIEDNFAPYKTVSSILEYGDLNAIKSPKVSVVVPIYNHPEYLEETLMSVINQDYNEEYEIIVVDNNMTQPKSPNYEIIKKLNNPKVLYYRHSENIRFEGNCNRGVELARAKYVSFCHDDDLFLPTTLSCLMKIQKETGDRCIVARYHMVDAGSNMIYKSPYPNAFLSRLKYTQVHHYVDSLYWLIVRCAWLQIGSLWNKEKYIACGGYSPKHAPCQDYGMHAIYAAKYGAVFCNEPTFMYRKANNASKELCLQFPERDRCIMSDLSDNIKYIPRFWLNAVISISVKNVINGNILTWGVMDKSKLQRLTIFEKIVKKTNDIIKTIRKF